ncbi:MAG TPA: APC family permease [Micromonosporaceae bacterium]|jgi:amino acid transporter|nr:APC family permease [Micromonosporaceae bacterium]
MSSSVSSPSAVSASLAKDRLGVWAVIMFAMTAATPLLVVGALVVSAWAGTGVVGYPLAFVLIGIVLAIFAAGYVAMARHVVNAGAFYSYIALGANKALGVGASFVAVLAYNLLQIGLYGIFGVVAQGFFQQRVGWDFQWYWYSLVAWLIVALMGALRVDINSKILGVLLLIELVLVVVFDVVDIGHPAGGSISVKAFEPHALFPSAALAGAAFAVAITSFVGFEAAPVFSEEARHARRTVPAATYLAIFVMGVVYAVTSWAITVAVGPDNVVGQAQQQGPDFIFNVAGQHLGHATTVLDIGHVLLLTSIFAGMVSYHNAVARYSFALGREGVLPHLLGRTRARTGAPLVSSIAQSTIALIVIIVFAVEKWDPLTRLFFWLGTTGGFGILVLLIGTSLSVLNFFRRDHRDESIWSRVLAPVLATATLGYIMWYVVDGFANLLGVGSHDPVRWIMPGLYLAVAVIGVLWALTLKGAKPDVYDGIGLGATAGTAVAAMTFSSATQMPTQQGGAGDQPYTTYTDR